MSVRFARTAALSALAIGAVVAAPLSAAASPPQASSDASFAGLDLYVDPFSTTLEAAQKLTGQARADAELLASIPSANWFTKGSPAEVRAAVDGVVTRAASLDQVPVLVAYNVPYRDCALYSAGGAADTAEYEAWIDGFAAGIGDRRAVVIIEPDGLGVIPHHTTLDGVVDSCQPADADPATASPERFAQLNHAVDAFAALPAVKSYLDGTSSAWLNVGEISSRLVKAGVERATGFFLNVSNYQFTTNSNVFGRWVSSCIALATQVQPGAFGECGNQYWNGGPANNWTGVAMSNYGEWTADAVDPALNTAGVDSRYAAQLGDVEPTAHFVVDTSRAGLGPWQYPAGVYPQHEDWCNPPGRGTGALPTTTTGTDLADAFLWIKVPGESDGQCYRGTSGPLDPARGMEDPAAGQWFAEQARELIAFSNPALTPLQCEVAVNGGTPHGKFTWAVNVRNTGADALSAWSLSWTFNGTQKVTRVTGGTVSRSGAEVTIEAARQRATLAPGGAATVVVKGEGDGSTPWQFRLNGQACATR